MKIHMHTACACDSQQDIIDIEYNFILVCNETWSYIGFDLAHNIQAN